MALVWAIVWRLDECLAHCIMTYNPYKGHTIVPLIETMLEPHSQKADMEIAASDVCRRTNTVTRCSHMQGVHGMLQTSNIAAWGQVTA